MSYPLLVTPKEHPDLDGVACAVAYAELLSALGTPALPFVSGRPDAEARYVLDRLGWRAPPVPAETGGLVLVDASDVLGLPSRVDPAGVIEDIDHRLHHRAASLFPNARLQIEPVGAAATLVFERFGAAGLRPTHTSSVLLLAAIHSNTQQLQGSVTTARDVEAARQLAAMSELPTGLIEGQLAADHRLARRPPVASEADVARGQGPGDRVAEGQLAARGEEIRDDLDGAIRREVKRFEHEEGAYLFSQIECAGAESLVTMALPALLSLGPRAMLNLVDPARPSSALLVPDASFRAWIAAKTGLAFDGVEARSQTVLLRKQIVARIEGHRP